MRIQPPSPACPDRQHNAPQQHAPERPSSDRKRTDDDPSPATNDPVIDDVHICPLQDLMPEAFDAPALECDEARHAAERVSAVLAEAGLAIANCQPASVARLFHA